MGIKVAKFGGSSLASAGQVEKVREIVEADEERRYVVPSAPGKRSGDDQKITDLLYLAHAAAEQNVPITDTFGIIRERYTGIVTELGLKVDIGKYLDEVEAGIQGRMSVEYAASRGEYLNGLVIADLLGYEFIDAKEVIFFNEYGHFDSKKTHKAIGKRLSSCERGVVPGFYGARPDGSIRTFSRGGSDITGAIVARGVGASVYENWTDVSGLLMADPRIVDNPKPIDRITYRELRELAYMGATVLHDEAIFPVREAGIPVHIRNTNEPGTEGTLILPDDAPIAHTGSITGIAGRKDFTIIAVEKSMMNQELGFGRRLLNVLEVNGISFEHLPSGIDTMSAIIADSQLDGRLEKVIGEIEQECHPDNIEVESGFALIATVGRGMAHTVGMSSRLFGALSKASVNIRMIDQGSSELNIIVGIDAENFDTAVRAIYSEFVE